MEMKQDPTLCGNREPHCGAERLKTKSAVAPLTWQEECDLGLLKVSGKVRCVDVLEIATGAENA